MKPKLILWIASLVVGIPLNDAAAAELLDEKSVLDAARTSVIPATVEELEAIGDEEAAATWRSAKVETAVLVWGFVQEAMRLEPSYWLVPVKSGKDPAGLLALDPGSAELVWRATKIAAYRRPAVETLLKGPQAAADQATKSLGAEEIKRYNLAAPMAASVNGAWYWLMPTKDEDISESLCVPAGTGGAPLMLWEAVARGQGLRPSIGLDLGSDLSPDLPPAPSASGAETGVTWMLSEVPRYVAADGVASWGAALSTVHQWWSPVSLGTASRQAEEVAKYLGVSATEPVHMDQLQEAMKNWDRVAETHKRKVGYQDFSRVWFGRGSGLDGQLAWRSNDMRAWLAHEAPVLLAVDADGRGPDESVDQVVVAVGYSLAHSMVYVVNPWGPADTFSIRAFADRYWSAWYSVSCDLPSLCATKTFSRRGMVAGTPGDLVGPATPVPIFAAPQAASDSQPTTISGIGMHLAPPLVPAFGGVDSFGDAYAGECTLTLPSAAVSGQGDKGGWDDMKTRQGADAVLVSATSSRTLYPGTVAGGARIDAAFKARGEASQATLEAACRVFDPDDRTHLQERVTLEVRDDSEQPDGSRQMLKPSLLSGASKSQAQISIHDDDPAPPRIRLLSPEVVYDSQKQPYRLKVAIDDWSGVAEAGVKWTFGGKQPPGEFEEMSSAGSGVYQVEVQRDEWVEHVGETLRFWVTASDTDDDSEGDRSKAVASFDVAVRDDDAQGPVVVQHVVQRAENNQFQVLVQLSDTSEILVTESWPKLYYSFSENLSLESFDGVTKLVRNPKYGEGWFSAVAPWGEEGIQEAEEQKVKKRDTLIFFKVRAIDRDADRESDEADSWSSPWWGVYLPAPAEDRTTITDIWPAGEDAVVEGTWNHWFELPPKDLPAGLFIEEPPTEEAPPSMPDVLPGGDRAVRLHFYLTRPAVAGGLTVTVGGSSRGSRAFALRVLVVSRKGVFPLATFTYTTQAKGGGGEQSVKVAPELLSTGENILVLEPASNMEPADSFGIERILLER